MKIKTRLLPLLVMLPLSAQADVLLIDDAPSVMTQENTPISGMSKQTVLQKYGQPSNKYTHSGKVTKRNPLISVWTYGNYKVYFENTHVIHTLIISSTLEPDEASQ